MLRTLSALIRTGGRGNAVLAPLGCVVGLVFLALAALGVWAVVTMPRLRVPLLVLPFLPLLGHWAEKRCDRLAADAGYGPDLLAVFGRWQESGQADRGGALAGRPTVTARAEALRSYSRCARDARQGCRAACSSAARRRQVTPQARAHAAPRPARRVARGAATRRPGSSCAACGRRPTP